MMISRAMNAKLNEQVTAEFSAAHMYLAMMSVFERMGLKVLAGRFREQHEEELEHALKIIDYVNEVGGTVALEAVPKPKGDFKSVEAIVETALEGEKKVTRMINELAALADSEKDYATRSFLNWFIDEQVEEVSTMTELLAVVQLAGTNVLQVESWIRHQATAEQNE